MALLPVVADSTVKPAVELPDVLLDRPALYEACLSLAEDFQNGVL